MKSSKRFNIFNTFDIFNAESISVLKDKLIEIVLIETDNIFATKNLFNIDFKKNNNVQISIINDKTTYDLLSNTWKRNNKKLTNEKNNKRKISY